MRARLLVLAFAIGCKASITSPPALPPLAGTLESEGESAFARQLLCGDVGHDVCRAACADDRSPREHAECLLAFRFAADPLAHAMARELYADTNALVGLGMHHAIDGFPGESIELFPALPLGEHRHHLAWLRSSLATFDAFVAALGRHSKEPPTFEPRPRAFMFYRTAAPTYPSAYCSEGVIAYNLDGPLHTAERTVLETLFHELFHINDARKQHWSETTLLGPFDAIIARCGDDHECFRPFAPHHTVVPDGTFYGFDRRTRDVREYAAELALRYFLEHEAVLAGARPETPFKCLAPENRTAWDLLAREFFGGADLTPSCDDG